MYICIRPPASVLNPEGSRSDGQATPESTIRDGWPIAEKLNGILKQRFCVGLAKTEGTEKTCQRQRNSATIPYAKYFALPK